MTKLSGTYSFHVSDFNSVVFKEFNRSAASESRSRTGPYVIRQ